MIRRDPDTGDGNGVDERERLARARLAFDEGLREVSETGARAARRMIVPALWGAALVGGTLFAFAMFRLLRRPSPKLALVRVSIEPHFESRPLLPAIGGAVARFALQRFLASAASSGTASSGTASSGTEGRAPASLAPRAAQQRNGSSHSNGNSGNGRAKS